MKARFLAALTVVFLLCLDFALAANCSVCGRAISGRGASSAEGPVCRQCYAERFYNMISRTCSVCGRQLTGGMVTDGSNYYCRDCAGRILGGAGGASQGAAGLKCSRCSRPISPLETHAEGRDSAGGKYVYCLDCARAMGGVPRQIRCSKCNSVISGGSFRTERDKYGSPVYTCLKCASGANRFVIGVTRCAVCGEPIRESSCYTSFNNVPFCVSCMKRHPERCMSCGLPVPRGTGVRNGSYVTCPACSRDLVTTNEALKELYGEACSFMKSYMGMEVPVPASNVNLADGREMSFALDKYRTAETPRDYCENPVGLFSNESGVMRIRIQKGMPRLEVLSTLVHESAHACMGRYGKPRPTLIFSEGFAVWCEYKFLSSIGETKYYLRKQENADPIYGEGLRRMLELEKSLSVGGVLEYVRTHRDFPQI